MIYLKECPHCHGGDLDEKSDIYGKYIECVQCGYLKDLPEPQSKTKPKRAATARATKS